MRTREPATINCAGSTRRTLRPFPGVAKKILSKYSQDPLPVTFSIFFELDCMLRGMTNDPLCILHERSAHVMSILAARIKFGEDTSLSL